MKKIIETENLSKYYNGNPGIIDLNFSIEEGEIYGFLGPNGAGKSTTIRLLLNLIRPTSGSARIFDLDIIKNHTKICDNIGNLPGDIKLYENLSGRYFLNYLAELSQKKPVLQNELLESFKLSASELDRRIKYYSRGMKRKLAIIQAMQHDPDLLIMDEPSEGLDPLMRNVLYDYIRRFKEHGKTVFFSSHNLAEVDKVCDHAGLVRDAKLIAEESISVLKTKIVRKMEIRFNQDYKKEDFALPMITITKSNDRYLAMNIQGDINPLIKILSGYSIENMVFPEPSLEETFMTFYN